MKCIFCDFENPDSEESCFRCGRSLNTDHIDVVPDRLKRGRPSGLWTQSWWSAQNRAALQMFRLPAYCYALLSLIPGLGQWAAGRPRRGVLALLVWIASMVCRLTLWPPQIWVGNFMLQWLFTAHWLPLTVHTTIIADAFRVAPNRPRGRLAAIQVVAVVVLSYGLLMLAHTSVNIPAPDLVYVQGYDFQDPTVRAGDTVSVWRFPGLRSIGVGAVVVFRPQMNAGLDERYRLQTDLIATVRATSGSRVAYRNKSLWINNVQLATPAWLGEFFASQSPQELTLTSEQYLLIPPVALRLTSLQELVVSRGQIRGVVTAIVDPLARRRTLRW